MDNNSTGNEQNNLNSTPTLEKEGSATTQQSNQTEDTKENHYVFNEKTIMASLSYVGPLVLIPFLTKREDTFIMFHVKQGLVVFGFEVVMMFLTMISFGLLAPITGLVNIGLLILSIIGILNSLQMKESQVPLLGKYANRIKI